MTEDEISYQILGCAIEVHRTLGGPGLLEKVYEEALVWEMRASGLVVGRQVPVPLRYKDAVLSTPLVLDLLVQDKVIVECKSVATYHDVHGMQALTYLRMTQLKLALVINFGAKLIREGTHRIVNNLGSPK